MSWIRPVGTKVVKYGPQAQLVWKHVGSPAAGAARRLVAAQNARRTALKHADTVVEGAILQVMHDGEEHWVVFSGGQPVAVYPPAAPTLSALTEHANRARLMTPDQARARQAAASRRRRAVDTVRDAGRQLRHRRDGG